MTYNAKEVARFIISYCMNKNTPVSNLKLQKILYFAWVDYWKQKRRVLYTDAICAWQFGPVVPDVYYEYCTYGGLPIDVTYETSIMGEDRLTLESIVEQYRKISAYELVNMTHAEGTPWSVTFQNGSGNRKVITPDLIQRIAGN